MRVKTSVTYEVTRDLAPIATVQPGKEFSIETLDCYSGRAVTSDALRDPRFFSKVLPLTGPVAVAGAAPGQWLAVTVRTLETASAGTLIMRREVGILGKYWNEWPKPYVFDVRDGFARNPQLGSFPIHPMIGTICVAPASGSWWSGLNGPHVGNVDCPELGEGATVILPVHVPGGNLCAGDGHAIMGHGELGGTGIEIGLRMTLTAHTVVGLAARPGNQYAVIRAADGWLAVIGRGKTADTAIRTALRNLRQWLQLLGCDNMDARISLQGEARICQLVNNCFSAAVGINPHAELEARIAKWLRSPE